MWLDNEYPMLEKVDKIEIERGFDQHHTDVREALTRDRKEVSLQLLSPFLRPPPPIVETSGWTIVPGGESSTT